MIYAISDVHGDKTQAIKLLKMHGVLNDDNQWAAGDAVLVVNGDSTDRGRHGIATLNFFYNLAQEAEQAGGRLIHTMGNHDAMILSMALQHREQHIDYEHEMIFKDNGGKPAEAKSLSIQHTLRHYVQSFPFMCKVDDVLFQHVDGFRTYEAAMGNAQTPEERIHKANACANNMAKDAFGAWQMFYDLTDDRYWNYREEHLAKYQAMFEVDLIVHGHTPFKGDTPQFYLDNTVVNIDAAMSSGYRKDENRGCVLVLDKPCNTIVV